MEEPIKSSAPSAPKTQTTPPQPPRPPEAHVVQSSDSPSPLSNILTIIGFIILIIIVVWGFIHLIQLALPLFSGGNKSTSMQVEAPAAAVSGEPITISWNYTTTHTGTFDFLYQCQDDLRFTTLVNDATSSIPCGAAFTAPAGKSITVTPTLTGTSTIAEPISILFIPSTGGIEAQGHATISVAPGTAPKTTKPSSTAPTSHASYSSSGGYASSGSYAGGRTYGGVADLSVRIISSNVNSAGVATLVFDIQNVGGSPSGAYSFVAYLPTMTYGNAQQYTFPSAPQASLNPGDHVVSTLTFTQAAPGTASVTVNGSDSNKANNYASAPLTGYNNAYNGSYGSGSVPQQYQYSY